MKTMSKKTSSITQMSMKLDKDIVTKPNVK